MALGAVTQGCLLLNEQAGLQAAGLGLLGARLDGVRSPQVSGEEEAVPVPSRRP